MKQFVYTIWVKEGNQKPKIIDYSTSKSVADKVFNRLIKNSSLGYKFRMIKNPINSKTKGKVIRTKN